MNKVDYEKKFLKFFIKEKFLSIFFGGENLSLP